MGPRYSSSTPRILPFCITSISPSRARHRAASLVGCMRLLQSIDERISPRLDNPRGISLGQHVFPVCLFCSRFSISSLSVSSDTDVSKYLDLCFFVAAGLDCGSSIFCFLDPFKLVELFVFVADSVVVAGSTKKSYRILLLFPLSSNTIPSCSSKRLFF